MDPEQRRRNWLAFILVAVVVLIGFGALRIFLDLGAFWAVLGIVIGVGLAGFWSPRTSRPPAAGPRPMVAPQPFSKLGRAAFPLTLPLLIVVVAGTAEASGVVQVIAGAVAGLFAWTLIVRPESERASLRAFLAAAALTIAYAVAAIVSNAVTDPLLGSFADRGGWSASFLRAAVVLWAVAIVLRLASFATSCFRMLEAVLLAAAVWCLVVWAGVIDEPWGLGENALAAGGVLLLLATLLLFAEALAGIFAVITGDGEKVGKVRKWTAESGGLSKRAAGFLAGFGLVTALFATLALGGAIVIGLEETSGEGHGRPTLASQPIKPEEPITAPTEQLPSDQKKFPDALVNTYVPELAFRQDEKWLPQRVDGYVRDSWLQGPLGEPMRGNTLERLPTSCPGVVPSPCYRLSIRCRTSDEPCSGAHEVGMGSLDHPKRSGAVYVRVVLKSEAPKLFPAGVGTVDGEKPSILIQYWYFYRYDEWTSPVLSGKLLQRHEGDWEAVTVGLSKDRPLFVAYSQHCAGEWQRWKSIEVADTGRPRTHPLVAVARGSQANYVRANQGHSPDWAGCSGKLPRGTATLLSYASNIRDFTGYDFGWEPEAGGIIPASDDRPPMSFPGYWGGNGVTQLVNERSHTLATGGEPKTPSMQPLWVDPLTTVFCRNWRYPRDTQRKCPPGT
jgi:hypothetical protein